MKPKGEFRNKVGWVKTRILGGEGQNNCTHTNFFSPHLCFFFYLFSFFLSTFSLSGPFSSPVFKIGERGQILHFPLMPENIFPRIKDHLLDLTFFQPQAKLSSFDKSTDLLLWDTYISCNSTLSNHICNDRLIFATLLFKGGQHIQNRQKIDLFFVLSSISVYSVATTEKTSPEPFSWIPLVDCLPDYSVWVSRAYTVSEQDNLKAN